MRAVTDSTSVVRVDAVPARESRGVAGTYHRLRPAQRSDRLTTPVAVTTSGTLVARSDGVV
jgi:hypothetical protein